MKISRILKLYRYKKAELATAQARIDLYKTMLRTGQFELDISIKSAEIGMPKSKNKISKPVEVEVFGREASRELTISKLKGMMKYEKSKAFALQAEVEQIDAALGALNYQDKQIVIWKYMDCLEWRDVELSFYETYKKPLTEESLRKRSAESLDKLTRLLRPFYLVFERRGVFEE